MTVNANAKKTAVSVSLHTSITFCVFTFSYAVASVNIAFFCYSVFVVLTLILVSFHDTPLQFASCIRYTKNLTQPVTSTFGLKVLFLVRIIKFYSTFLI